MVMVGVAVTLARVDELNPVEGFQRKEVAVPVVVSATLWPLQTVEETGVALTVGRGLTVTTTVVELEQPVTGSVPETV